MFKKRETAMLLEQLMEIREYFQTDNIGKELYHKAGVLTTQLRSSKMTMEQRRVFSDCVQKIEGRQPYYTKNSALNRMSFSELVMGNLREGNNNSIVIQHIKKILPQIEDMFYQNLDHRLCVPHDSKFYELKSTNDISEALRDISNKEYYYTLARIDDYLMRKNNNEIELAEISIIFTLLNGILLAAESENQLNEDVTKEGPSYLQLLKDYQDIEKEVETMRDVVEKTTGFLGVLRTKYGIELSHSFINKSSIFEDYENLNKKLHKFEGQNYELKKYLNCGNLRNVIETLYEEKGLTAAEFGEAIGYSEEDIILLVRQGTVTSDLLDKVCKYFGILKTPDFTRYL